MNEMDKIHYLYRQRTWAAATPEEQAYLLEIDYLMACEEDLLRRLIAKATAYVEQERINAPEPALATFLNQINEAKMELGFLNGSKS
jgi:hypothetical protein